ARGRQGAQNFLKLLLAPLERQRAQVPPVEEHQIEGEENQWRLASFRERGLQCGEIGNALAVERHRLPIDQTIRQCSGGVGYGGESLRPVEPLAREQRGAATLHPQLQPVAVELDLVHPAALLRRPRQQSAERRLDEL